MMFRFRNQREAELWEDCVRVLMVDEELGVDHACCLADDVVEQFRKRQPDPIPDAGPTPADMRGEVEHRG